MEKLIEIFSDKSRSVSHKLGWTVLIVFFFCLADSITKFTYNNQLNNKLEQIEKIEIIKKNLNDSVEIKKWNTLKNKIIVSKHYSEYLNFNYLKNKNNKNIDDNNKIKEPSLFWMVVSSNFLILLIIPLMLIAPFFPGNGLNSDFLLGWFTVLVFLAGYIFIVTWIAYQIPIIDGENIKYNYWLNGLIHTSLGILSYIKLKK